MGFGRIGGMLVIGGGVLFMIAAAIVMGGGSVGLGLNSVGGLLLAVALALVGSGAAGLSVVGPRPLNGRAVRVGRIGQGEGSGLMPNGTFLGDGERMLAYRGGDKPVAWTSSDGRSWRTIAIGGSPTTATGSGTLVLMPIGVLWIGDDGSTWFGQPAT